jgi:hypothetical protein
VSTSIQQFAGRTEIHERRQHPRIIPDSLIYVACGEANGGMVLNASDDGLAISMAIPISDEAFSNVHVRMNGLPQVIQVPGRMLWTTPSRKRAGIQLINTSDYDREQIREWISLEGVRDVNLVPRTALDEGAADHSDFAVAAAKPETNEQMYPSLLEQFGGTEPESLGPVGGETLPVEGSGTGPELPPRLESASAIGFRDNEWDLAAVTILPPKKSRPEGLSAFAVALLWIAIPTFGLALLVGRRPLEQWLSRGDAAGNDKSGTETVQGPVNLPLESGSEAVKQLEISQVMAPATVEPPATKTSTGPGLTNIDLPASGSGSTADANLLNSMSTQEAHALVHSKSAEVQEPAKPDATINAKTQGNTDADRRAIEIPPSGVKPVEAPRVGLQNNKNENNLTSSARASASAKAASTASGDTKTPAAAILSTNTADGVPKTVSIDSGFVAREANNSPSTRSQPATNSAVSPTKTTAAMNGAPDLSNNSASAPTKPTSLSAMTADPAMKPATPPTSRAAAPAIAPSPAPTTSQPPLHGVMLVARKGGEGLSLKLPVESVANERGASVQIQRYITVPPQSRWHHRGPIAKLKIGELLTPAAPDTSDAAIRPHDGDTVTVRALLDKNGSVEDLKLVSGRFALVPRVMRTVREWQFDQTLVDGKPVASEVNVTVTFRASR